ncbi:proton-conducting transporter transmembrane domain-containing protein [Hydrogenothermus marinus]|uniref:NADH-quinone oxidoreductase subunit L n=1 Tax=Hydrogenothermus marinus TaxID=133270 RepID=A0A3M0BLH4_9AQUI|nr:proton-conducting transporter membrane subunit [Hydrogenothermus marinus]RMA97119.1 NADH-quinone oxidoreductase subunit L [Hydrogenothermus marinus]
MEKTVLLIPFIPVIIAFLISFINSKEAISKISMYFSFLIAVLGIAGAYYVIANQKNIYGFGDLLIFNEMASILVVYVAILGIVIRKYSAKYMWDEKGFKRFYILLNFIFAAIYLLIMSNNIIVLAIAWQIMSLTLYFLVSFKIEDKQTVKFGSWTILIHKLADFLFIIGIILVYKTFGIFNLTELSKLWLERYEYGFSGNIEIYLIGFLFLFAALMKSANIPFHIWLPYTSSAPTPVSALMHAGVVNVGGIVLNKLAFLLLLTPTVLNVAFIFGLITAIFASIIMLAVPDIKRSLGYSTVGQMGYMIMEIGIGAFSLAIYHLMVHGIFKASLFLESGSLIHYARHDPNIPKKLSYEVFWEEKVNYSKNFYWIIALFTILPVLIFAGIKFIISEEFFYFNTAIVILAFAWLTSTQLFLSFFKVSKSDSLKVIFGLLSSFILVVFTYEFFGSLIEKFLYGENAKLFYKVASLDISIIISLGIMFLILIIGWLFIYKTHFIDIEINGEKPNKIKWVFYKILAKESFFPKLMFKISKFF